MYRIVWLIVIFLFAMPVYAQNPSLPANLEVITVDNIDRLHELAAIKGTAPIQNIVWSPDGERLAVLRGDLILNGADDHRAVEIWHFDVAQLPVAPDTILTPHTVNKMDWLSDSRTIVTHGAQYTDDEAHFLVVKWDVQTGKTLKTLLDTIMKRPLVLEYEDDKYYGAAVPPILAWNNDYSQFVAPNGSVALRFSDGHMYRADYPDTYGHIHRVLWTPDDKYILVDFGSQDTYHIEVLAADTFKSVLYAYGEDYSISNIAWSPDNMSFAVASSWSNPFNPLINVRFYKIGEEVEYGGLSAVLSAQIPENIPGGQGRYISDMAWSPDGTIIGINFPVTLEFYETTSLSYTKIAAVTQAGITSLAWHPHGKFLVTSGVDGALRLWGVESTQ